MVDFFTCFFLLFNKFIFRSPTHAGGLLAIDRQWFFELGAYDPGIRVWGAEQYVLILNYLLSIESIFFKI